MSACTSPEDTTRSTPRRISRPSTDARNPSTLRTLTASPPPEIASHARHIASPVTQSGTRGVTGRSRSRRRRRSGRDTRAQACRGQAQRLAGEQRKRGAVLPALDLALVGPEVAFAQRVVLVRAGVVDRVPVVVEVHDADLCAIRRRSTPSLRVRCRTPRTRARRPPLGLGSRDHVAMLDLLDHGASQRSDQ